MILAGIDEAGYGPLLGPLVVGCCAFELADESAPGDDDGEFYLPCLWKRLQKQVGRSRCRTGRRLHINDSKLVYSPADGLKELERSVLALAATTGAWPEGCTDLAGMVSAIAGHALTDLADYEWYQAYAGESFPLRQSALPVRLSAKALSLEMQRREARCVHLGARIVFERQLNGMFERMRNKADALFTTSAIHIDALLRRWGDRDLTIICDRQGARGHYGPLLRLMFDDWELEIVRETAGCSDYALTRAGARARLSFREKAEGQCLPVAVASMVSKYLREAMMARFNAWWSARAPGVRPTAGYYNDGLRFLQDIDAVRRSLGVTDPQLVRSR